MLNDLDETIKQVLIRAGGGDFDAEQVDISFDIPNREWSTGIQRPTINCYLFDIHERRALREEGWQTDGRGRNDAARRKPLLFFDISYLITAWTRAIENEHYLLWRALATLSRFPILSDQNMYLDDDILDNPFVERAPIDPSRPRLVDCLQGALSGYAERESAPPIYTSVAQLEGVLKSPGEFWTALENHLKPSLNYVVTLAMDRQAMRAGPPVLATGVRLNLPESTAEAGFRIDRIVTLPPNTPLGGIRVSVDQPKLSTKTDAEGMFFLNKFPPGRYLLRVELGTQAVQRVVILRDPAARGRSRLSDVVRDQDGSPIAGVLVEVEGTELRSTTGADGRFAFDLAPGTYTLIFHFEGGTQRRRAIVRNTGYTLTLNYGGKAPAP